MAGEKRGKVRKARKQCLPNSNGSIFPGKQWHAQCHPPLCVLDSGPTPVPAMLRQFRPCNMGSELEIAAKSS